MLQPLLNRLFQELFALSLAADRSDLTQPLRWNDVERRVHCETNAACPLVLAMYPSRCLDQHQCGVSARETRPRACARRQNVTANA
jgi:hypothetical protein